MLSEGLKRLLEESDRAAVEHFYADDALLDANVPVWRFQRKGIDDIAEQYAEWFGPSPARVVGLREWRTPFGGVVETEHRQSVDGVEYYSRQLHLLFTDGGKVSRHVMYCSGEWDAALEARQKAEAPMFEP